MKHIRHSYVEGFAGRSIRSRTGVGGRTIVAQLKCSSCGRLGELNCRTMFPPEQMDKKFVQSGWTIDPHLCVDCIRKRKEAKMSSVASIKPSSAAIRAQAKCVQLLTLHFDVDRGAYAAGWNDGKIANETGLSNDVVVEFRREAFGEIKEPEEIRRLRDDINAASKLAEDSFAAIQQEIASLRSQLGQITRKFAA